MGREPIRDPPWTHDHSEKLQGGKLPIPSKNETTVTIASGGDIKIGSSTDVFGVWAEDADGSVSGVRSNPGANSDVEIFSRNGDLRAYNSYSSGFTFTARWITL